MDPNATLARILDALCAKQFRPANAAEARYALEDLIAWLARGGFSPADPRKGGE